jgi:hypothetical protein
MVEAAVSTVEAVVSAVEVLGFTAVGSGEASMAVAAFMEEDSVVSMGVVFILATAASVSDSVVPGVGAVGVAAGVGEDGVVVGVGVGVGEDGDGV